VGFGARVWSGGRHGVFRIEVARAFFVEAVRPILHRELPGLRYAAGRLGSGSDVLALDDAMSRDHDWGCRLTLLVDEPDRDVVPVVREVLERDLPERFEGHPVQRLPFVGRTAERGDELGSRMLSTGLAADLMWLAYALSREWRPYEKWRGTALRRRVQGALEVAAGAGDWREREAAVVAAAEVLGEAQRARGLPTPDVVVTGFWDRPYRTVDEGVRRLPMVGSVEQWADSVDVLSSQGRRAALREIYLRDGFQ
jgi:hypothetical protein